MIEVPALALVARLVAPHVDLFSIGTNDLAQYTLAAERGNAAVAHLADPLHPAVLRLIAGISEAAGPGVRVAVCGEVGGEPAATPLLVGLGVHELSMSPPAIPAVKEAVRSLSATGARALAALTLDQHSAAGVRTLLDSSGSTRGRPSCVGRWPWGDAKAWLIDRPVRPASSGSGRRRRRHVWRSQSEPEPRCSVRGRVAAPSPAVTSGTARPGRWPDQVGLGQAVGPALAAAQRRGDHLVELLRLLAVDDPTTLERIADRSRERRPRIGGPPHRK